MRMSLIPCNRLRGIAQSWLRSAGLGEGQVSWATSPVPMTAWSCHIHSVRRHDIPPPNIVLGWRLTKNTNFIEPTSSNPDSTVENWGKQFLRRSTGKESQGLQNSAMAPYWEQCQLLIFCDVLMPNEPLDIKAIPNVRFLCSLITSYETWIVHI